MTKRAVVVGVNDYSVQGANNLNGCARDAQAMYHLLVQSFLFAPDQTWCYTDTMASSSTIRQAIRYMLSVSEPGDVACFFFSGHGGLHPVSDSTSYQTIIPYSGRYITDWDLWAAAEALQPSHVNFTVILDSCHSGGMHEETENPAGVRGIRYAREFVERLIAALRKVIPFGVTVPGADAYQNNVSNLRIDDHGLVCMDEDPNQQFVPQAKSTLISACRWDQLAQESPGTPTTSQGHLTKAFLNIVNQSNFLIDHRSLHQTLIEQVHRLNPAQTPQLRGQQNRMEEDFLVGWRDSR